MSKQTKATPTEAQRLGREIREVRKARGMTLNDLSSQVECSVAYLSRVERGTTRLSVELLNKLSRALNVDASWFFPVVSGDGPMERQHIVRSTARRSLSEMYTRPTTELGFSDELLSSTISGDCYLLLSRFKPGIGNSAAPQESYAFEGEQHGVIITGEVILILNDEKIILYTGDSFSYPSTLPHRFYNNSQEESIMVWAMSPVRISW